MTKKQFIYHISDPFKRLAFNSTYVLLVLAFSEKLTHDHDVASTALFCLSYKKALFALKPFIDCFVTQVTLDNCMNANALASWHETVATSLL